MSKFLSSKKEYISYLGVLSLGLLMSALAASASTTISTNISTGGTLTVTGVTLLGQATSTMLSAHTAYFGQTATSTFTSAGYLGVASSSPYVALGVTGTTTSSLGMVIGKLGTGITQLAFGRCTPTIGSILASTTLSAICVNSTGTEIVDNGVWKIFITPKITEDKNLVFVSASSTALGIQVTLLNVNNTGVGAVDPTDNAWDWMAVR